MLRSTAKSGVDFLLEEMANELLRKSRKGVTKLSEKKDFFTEEQLALRRNREVYSTVGSPDRNLMSGLYRRAYNPLAGHRPTRLRSSDE